jgi:hypothetical protein
VLNDCGRRLLSVHYLRVSARHGKNPAKSSVARKLLIAAWHMLSRDEPSSLPPRRR